MASSHLKRIVAPKTWPILRKTTKFIARPKPSGQKMELTMPIVVVIREQLGLVQTSAQARKILHAQPITVNGKRVYDTDSAVGFMDVLSIGGKQYRMLINQNNNLYLAPAHDDLVLQKVCGKNTLPKGRTQLACTSGRTIIVDKDAYKTGDSVAVGKDGKVADHYPLVIGACVLLTGGNHIGKVGTVVKIDGKTIIIKTDGQEIQTATTHAFVIGKDKPAISLK